MHRITIFRSSAPMRSTDYKKISMAAWVGTTTADPIALLQLSSSEAKAATKIQSTYRGKKVRDKMQASPAGARSVERVA